MRNRRASTVLGVMNGSPTGSRGRNVPRHQQAPRGHRLSACPETEGAVVGYIAWMRAARERKRSRDDNRLAAAADQPYAEVGPPAVTGDST